MKNRIRNDINYQAKLLNRLARRARRHGLATMLDSLNRAQWRIWAMLDSKFEEATGRPDDNIRSGYNMRGTV